MEFECNIFPGFTTLQLVREVQEFLSKMSVEPENFTGRIIFMSMLNDISCGSKDNGQECELSAKLVSIFARRFSPGKWSFFGLGSEKKWYSTLEYKPQGEWDRVAEQIMIKFAESGHPVFRATSPLSRGMFKSKGGGIYLFTSVPMVIRLKLFFAQSFLSISSVSTERSQICVKNTVSANLAQGDLLWQSNLTHFSRQQTY